VLPDLTLSDGVVTLRAAQEGDVARMVEACQDPEIPRWTSVPSPYTEADARAWLAEMPRLRATGAGWPFLLVDAADDELVGSMGLVALDRERAVAEIGYWTAPWARRRGLTSRGVVLLRDAAVQRLGVREVELLVDAGNTGSAAVAARTAFARAVGPRATLRPAEPGIDVYVWSASSAS
jgi:RimJ/RimL family protein N-acetyltransferase